MEHAGRARFAAAAPEMARLLLELDHSWGCVFCRCAGHAPDCRYVAGLRKAGVETRS
jgi:hypothetical protein